MSLRPATALFWLALCVSGLLQAQEGAASSGEDAKSKGPLRFAVSFEPSYSRKALDGSLYLLVSSDLIGEPRHKVHHFKNAPHIFRVDVTRMEQGDMIVFDESTPGYPSRLSELKSGRYSVQAIFHKNQSDYDFTQAHGNGRSLLRRFDLDAQNSGIVPIKIDTEITRAPLRDLTRIQYRNIESRLVGRHLGRRFYATTAVVLPEGYGTAVEEGKTFPIQYWIPNLGMRARNVLQYLQEKGLYNKPTSERTQSSDFIRVIIDPHGPWGHHLWADSEVNGPFMTAFFEEFMPAVEKEFAVDARPENRFLVGYGLGGWAAVNLLSERPNLFGGAWALAPHPLDFSSFYGLDLTTPSPGNAFVVAGGLERPLIRKEGRVVTTMRKQLDFERVLGRGGLITSFESSLGLRHPNKSPRPLIDRRTGAVDERVRQRFMQHDISRRISQRGAAAVQAFSGKLRLGIGDADDFYLVRPTLLFRRAVERAGGKVNLRTIPNANHLDMNSKVVHLELQRDVSKLWKKLR